MKTLQLDKNSTKYKSSIGVSIYPPHSKAVPFVAFLNNFVDVSVVRKHVQSVDKSRNFSVDFWIICT